MEKKKKPQTSNTFPRSLSHFLHGLKHEALLLLTQLSSFLEGNRLKYFRKEWKRLVESLPGQKGSKCTKSKAGGVI